MDTDKALRWCIRFGAGFQGIIQNIAKYDTEVEVVDGALRWNMDITFPTDVGVHGLDVLIVEKRIHDIFSGHVFGVFHTAGLSHFLQVTGHFVPFLIVYEPLQPDNMVFHVVSEPLQVTVLFFQHLIKIHLGTVLLLLPLFYVNPVHAEYVESRRAHTQRRQEADARMAENLVIVQIKIIFTAEQYAVACTDFENIPQYDNAEQGGR